MKKIVLTGSSGFIGSNIFEELSQLYEVKAPTRRELDLRDTQAVWEYLKREQFDAIIHTAIPNPVKNVLDQEAWAFEEGLRMFMNLYEARALYGKMIYLGSGAEFDKSQDMRLVGEAQIGRAIPRDSYGFSKYLMNSLARQAQNVYNLRIFACFGEGDHESKFITHAIASCLEKKPITIRQNCYFDYMYVKDLVQVITWFVEHQPKYQDYNVCTGRELTLEQIAKEVASQMNGMEIVLLKEGYNNAYTASPNRLLEEMKGFCFTSIEEGIRRQIEWQKGEKK